MHVNISRFIGIKLSLHKLIGCGILWLTCLFWGTCKGQSTSYNFRHLTTNDGLSNGVIRSIAQDKYGYMWLATASGVCLYNGYNVKAFLHSDKEPLSVPDNLPVYIFCDKNKNVWVSFESGLYKYNYNNSSFILQPQTSHVSISKMVGGERSIIYCSTRKGLMLFNTSDGNFTQPKAQNAGLLQRSISDIYLTNKSIYLATDTGLIIYQPSLQYASLKKLTPIEKEPIYKLAVDANNNVWVSYGQDRNLVYKLILLLQITGFIKTFYTADRI